MARKAVAVAPKRKRAPKKAPQAAVPRPAVTGIVLKLETKLVDDINAVLEQRGTNIETYIRLQLRAFRHAGKILGLNDRLNFGKFSGELVEDVCRAEPGYVEWLIANSTSARFHQDVLSLLEELREKAEEIPL
jgi:hypothetical protein